MKGNGVIALACSDEGADPLLPPYSPTLHCAQAMKRKSNVLEPDSTYVHAAGSLLVLL